MLSPQADVPKREDMDRIEMLASQIRDNKQLKRVLRRAKPELRLDVFRMIKPYLRFQPKPWGLLK